MLKKLFSKIFCCIFLFVCFLLLFLSSCSKFETTTDVTNMEDQSANAILTNIFTETEYNVPDDFRMLNNVIPYYDQDAETVTIFSQTVQEILSEDSVITEKMQGWLYTFTLSGEILETEEIPLPKDLVSIFGGRVTEDSLIYIDSTVSGKVIYRTYRMTGETISTERSTDFFGKEDFSYAFLTVDDDGLIYCTDRETLFVLNPDLSLEYSFDFPTQIYTMARGTDGEIWVTFNAGMESCAAKIEKDAKKLGDYYIFTKNTNTLEKTQHHLIDISFSDGIYDFYYYDTDILYGVKVEENGSLTETLVTDFYNSGIDLERRENYFNRQAGYYAVALLSDDLLMTTLYDGWRHSIPVLYYRSEDIDLTEIQSITIAHAYALDTDIITKITQFNKTHPEVRIVIQDYSTYATQEEPTAGEEKLCFDMMNGFIQPDIVVTRGIEKTIADNSVMNQLCRNQLYVDLVPYLEKDDTVNFDTLFGCIPHLFEDGNGGMWGITTDFTISTLIGNPTLLGEYANKGYWNLEEMFDFFDSLPIDTEKYFQFTHVIPNWQLMGQGYNLFIGDTDCTFTSGTFTRYLEFLNSVPTTFTEWKTLSPYANLTSEEQIAALHAGKIGLEFLYISQAISSYDAFKAIVSGEIIPIGYATKTDTGTRINANHVYSITTFAEDEDLCFEIVKSFFTVEEFRLSDSSNWPIFALKPQFEQAMRTYGSVFQDSILSQGELEELYDFLDNIGIPLTLETSSAIDEIVEEEISAYLAGVGTADDCAEKIQSRVEIWLAEHE